MSGSPPTLADRYELIEVIGTGGMAHVWRADDRELRREVAVKVLRAGPEMDPSFATRFRREARLVASLSHPNIVTVYDFGIDGGRSYIVMELVDGTPLREMLGSRRRLPVPVTAALAVDTLSALHHAHARGIVHRDVKPGNILVSRGGIVKVADFGIAKSSADTTEVTSHGSFVGTASYASPEQLRGSSIGPASDLYSLGCVLYQCLAGRPPFEADDVEKLAVQHRVAEVRPLAAIRSDVPEALSSAIGRALAKDPADRFADARQMGDMIATVDRASLGEVDLADAGTADERDPSTLTGDRWRTEADSGDRPTGNGDPPGRRGRRIHRMFRLATGTPGHRRSAVVVALSAAVLVVVLSVSWNLGGPRGSADSFGASVIPSGGFLRPGQSVHSSNRQFRLTMQSDGNLVDYSERGGRPLWESGTSGNFGAYAVVQADGDVVVYPEGRSAPAPGQPTPALWSSGSFGHAGAHLELQADGGIAVRGTGGGVVVWIYRRPAAN